MQRLHHRVIDELEKRSLLQFFIRDVEEQLAALGPDVLSEYIDTLVGECESKKRKADSSKEPNGKKKAKIANTERTSRRAGQPALAALEFDENTLTL